MLNDAAWDLVFPHIQAEIAESGFTVLEASELKRLSGREPRLMAKHDFSAARPQVFQEHGLSMLPIRRDAYLIGRFNLYQPFPEQAGPLTTMPVPRLRRRINGAAARTAHPRLLSVSFVTAI